MAEHIDQDLLYTNLRYRFDYLCKFLNFTENDIVTLNNFAKIAQEIIPSIAHTIYEKLLEYDITKNYFLKRHFGFNGIVPTNETQLTLQSEQMLFRIESIRKYFYRVFRQRVWNDEFLHYLSNVGKMHTSTAGAFSINVDYIHINALLGYLQHVFMDAVLRHEEIDATVRNATLLALNKVFCIQCDFFTMHYITTPNADN